ncbi:DUF6233 domain-containing protein [Streptomyces kanasensis]|uniref:DUF6233 domain-containing protein n=1 Tax=Streptomyces kanasensis TaxID=936756 RepID=UPI0036FBEBE3
MTGVRAQPRQRSERAATEATGGRKNRNASAWILFHPADRRPALASGTLSSQYRTCERFCVPSPTSTACSSCGTGSRWPWWRPTRQIARLQAQQPPPGPASPPPSTPVYRIQLSPGAGRTPVQVNVGACGKSRKAHRVSADTARRTLAEGVQACEVCRPDTELGILDAG